MTSPNAAQPQQNQFGWLVNEFVERVPGVAHAVVVSADGLLLTSSNRLPLDRADQLAAVASGIVSLTQGAARCFEAGAVNETVVYAFICLFVINVLMTAVGVRVLARH